MKGRGKPLASRTRLGAVLLLALATIGAPACSATEEADDGYAAVSEADATAVLDLHLLDIWAQPLDGATLTIKTPSGQTVRTQKIGTGGSVRVLLGGVATYDVRLTAADHVPLDVRVEYDGSAVRAKDPSRGPDGGQPGIGLGRGDRRLTTRTVRGLDLYLGLRHHWFSAQGRPARRGNAVKLLMNGEESWRDVHARIGAARSSILASTWWWDSNFELVRDNPMAPIEERRKNTILSVLERSPAEKKILVGQFLGSSSLVSWMTSDSGLRNHVGDPKFQFMREGNDARGSFRFEPKTFAFSNRVRTSTSYVGGTALDASAGIVSTVPSHQVDITNVVDIASVHQKFIVVDGSTAYVSGMNFRETDWDSSNHAIFDVRRLPFAAPEAERAAVADARCPPTVDEVVPMLCPLPEPGPRADYTLRVDGPAVADAIDVFQDRWNGLIDRRASDAEGRSLMSTSPTPIEKKGDVAVQITATMPAPFEEAAIAETWFNAIRNAERFVYVEDQYFRMPMMHDALVKRMEERPDLQLVVVTSRIGVSDAGCAPSRDAYQLFVRRFPNRFQYLTLRSFDPRGGRYDGYADIFVHSKMLIVDDVFMSVGSANKNNRGLVYEYELNAAVHDEAFVTAARKRILRAHVPSIPETDDAKVWFAQLKRAAIENQRRHDANQDPEHAIEPADGFLFPLEAPPNTCLLPTVGPDST